MTPSWMRDALVALCDADYEGCMVFLFDADDAKMVQTAIDVAVSQLRYCKFAGFDGSNEGVSLFPCGVPH